MKIGIVVSYISKNPAGLERYAYELLRHIVQEGSQHHYIIYTKNKKSLEHLSFLHSQKNVELVEVGYGKLWKDIGLFLAPRSDVYLFTGPQGPLWFHPQKNITIAYDFGYKFFEKGIRGKIKNSMIDFYSSRAFSIADFVVCLSKETQKDVMRYFGISIDKTKVIYPGFNTICLIPDTELADCPEKFFLFVGTIKERKNVLGIVKGFHAFTNVDTKNTTYSLLLCGKFSKEDPYYQEILAYIRNTDLEKRVRFLGHVTDGQVSFLYKKARALVYPSFIEGFGLPLLEAMSCSLPVITSNISSLGEIAHDDNAVRVDPHSEIQIGEAMHTLVHDEVYRNNLVVHGREYSERFSWKKMAREFLVLIESL